jgi:hypothetical protein
MWTAKVGSATVFINGKGAHRVGDATLHCGGRGQLIEGSPNVMIGDLGGGAAPNIGGPDVVTTGGRDASAAHEETRAMLHEAAKSGKGLVKRDHQSCHDGEATVTAGES